MVIIRIEITNTNTIEAYKFMLIIGLIMNKK
jgi:hypothetical protein